MKTKIIIAVAAFSAVLASCQSLKEEFQPVFTGKYESPAVKNPSSMTATITIAELASTYVTGKPSIMSSGIISGIVSTTDQPGNFYKSFYIQDETGGMEIKIGKNGLYNDYLPGQRVYVDCADLCLGMYGYKSGSSYGNGMIQIGFSDPSGDYETSYMESPLLINTHVFTGAVEGPVSPVELQKLPSSTATQASDHNIGKLVTIRNLTYGWRNTRYNEDYEAFVLLYLDSSRNKKESSNRIFVSGTGTGITTWAMSKNKMSEYLLSGVWDSLMIGNANDYNYGSVGDLKGDGSYPGIERAAASVSHYFHIADGSCVQIRTSGYSKFCDSEIDPDVLAGKATIDVTGILNLYQGGIQIVVNSLDDIVVNK